MAQILLLLVVLLVLGAVGYGVVALVRGGDQGLEPVEPDESAVALPTARPLTEGDVSRARFDVAFRGYRMNQVDRALRRAAYDIGYKEELIGVLEAEVAALRDGRTEDAETLRRARIAALGPSGEATAPEPATEPAVEPAVEPVAGAEPAAEAEPAPEAPGEPGSAAERGGRPDERPDAGPRGTNGAGPAARSDSGPTALADAGTPIRTDAVDGDRDHANGSATVRTPAGPTAR